MRPLLCLVLACAAVGVQAQAPADSVLVDSSVADSLDVPEPSSDEQGWLLQRRLPDDPERRLTLARELSWHGHPADAVVVYDTLLASNPDDEVATFELGRLLIWNGDPARAVQLIAPLAERDRDSVEVQSTYAYALHASGKSDAARRQYDRALRLTPDDPTLLFESGTLERWEGDWSTGRFRIRRALDLGLDEEPRGRARTLLKDLAREHAPRVGLSIERSTDSNGLTRDRIPTHSHVVFSSTLAAGVVVSQERLTQVTESIPVGLDASTTNLAPYIAFTPRRDLALRAGIGVQAVRDGGTGPSGWLEATWTRTSPRFIGVTARVQSQAGVEGVRALGDGIRTTTVTAESYAEPVSGLGIGVSIKGTSYSDDNHRIEVSSSSRIALARVGPVAISALAGAGYETTEELYSDSDPYWTPRQLLTVLGGGGLTLKPTDGVTLEPEVYTTFQRDPNVHSLSLGYRLRATLDRGRHSAGLLLEQSGSNSYSVQRVGLRYEISIW